MGAISPRKDQDSYKSLTGRGVTTIKNEVLDFIDRGPLGEFEYFIATTYVKKLRPIFTIVWLLINIAVSTHCAVIRTQYHYNFLFR